MDDTTLEKTIVCLATEIYQLNKRLKEVSDTRDWLSQQCAEAREKIEALERAGKA